MKRGNLHLAEYWFCRPLAARLDLAQSESGEVVDPNFWFAHLRRTGTQTVASPVDGSPSPPDASFLENLFPYRLLSKLRSTNVTPRLSMASKSQASFAQRASAATGLTRTLFEIAERKKTNIVLSADLTTTDELLKIANGRCHLRTMVTVTRAGVLD